ncbi:MAG: Rrf2 family transcriptional regulator [Betaproteobacteria bacterium]|jgi:Rrf2 family protein|nr:MAG: Rrf2 family transcriptional regulator [Betaproteobacteria bacterium]
MPTSSRLAVAVHTLATLALHKGEPVRSEVIAKSASTNPAVIRRLLSMLNAAGLSQSQLGQGGGSLLAQPPEAISLLDVYKAVENEQLFALHRTEPSDACTVGKHIQHVLQGPFTRAGEAMEGELANVSIADIVRDIQKLAKRKTA